MAAHQSSSEAVSPSSSGTVTADHIQSVKDYSSTNSFEMERHGESSVVYRWTVTNFSRLKPRPLWSKYFEVGGFDCRLLLYPKGDSLSLPGYISLYIQIVDPRGTNSAKRDYFAHYKLSLVNFVDDSKTINRDYGFRFSNKQKSHGWREFTTSSAILAPTSGFIATSNDSILITADVSTLVESVNFSSDNNEVQCGAGEATLGVANGPVADILSGRFTWKVHNFSIFRKMMKTQKIYSPLFPAGDCNLRILVCQNSINSEEYLTVCLEIKDTDMKSYALTSDKSCWCLFRMSVLNHKPGLNHVHKDSYGRFAADSRTGDKSCLGSIDFMKMSDFLGQDAGFLVDDTATFSAWFYVIKESISFSRNGGLLGVKSSNGGRKSDWYGGKFTWRIENFTKLKDFSKKRKIAGLCVKSRRFQIGNQDCRLVIYPRGKSQPPSHLSMFLELTGSASTPSDWSCFISHKLSIVNQKMEEKSVTKELQTRYSKTDEDLGWCEFVTLTSLFDQDYGFIVQDTVTFSAEVLILREYTVMEDYCRKRSFTWKVQNFLAFKDVLKTKKIFSKFFEAGGCNLRIGVYESSDTLCIYLESDQSIGSDTDKNFWVRYRISVMNQTNPDKTVRKEYSMFTRTWNNSVLQFLKVSDLLSISGGFLVRDTLVFVCEVLDCCPWFDFSDLEACEVLASDDDQDALTTDLDELTDFESSECISDNEGDTFTNLQQPDVVAAGERNDQLSCVQDDFATYLSLAEALSLSRNPHLKGFVKLLYTNLLKWHSDDSCCERMLKRLVHRAISSTDSDQEIDFDLDVLELLVSEEQEYVRPVLRMVREVVELSNADRAALWDQFCANENELVRIREERKAEVSRLDKERTLLSQKLTESETSNTILKSEKKSEVDRLSREKKELLEQMQELGNQLDWLISQRNEEVAKLKYEKRVLKERLHDAEVQIAQLSSRKNDELKRLVKEKNALSEQLKSSEAARKRLDVELKRCSTENFRGERIRQSLEDEVLRLKQTVSQTEGEKREKEEQVFRCEAYIDGMESKLQTCQQYVRNLEKNLSDEMSRNAPLYGVGLEDLSMSELETLAKIHEDGLKQIRDIQDSNRIPVGSFFMSPDPFTGTHTLFPDISPRNTQTCMNIGPSSSPIPNEVIDHGNGKAVRSWFNHK